MKVTYAYEGQRRDIPGAREQDGIRYLTHIAALDLWSRGAWWPGDWLGITVMKESRRWKCSVRMKPSGMMVVQTKEVKPHG